MRIDPKSVRRTLLSALLVAAFATAASACSSPAERPAANFPHRRLDEIVWHKAAGGACPAGTFDGGYACAVCDARDGGDCQRLCDSGNGSACTLLGSHHEFTRSEEDLKRARALYERGCELDSGLGCEWFAKFLARGTGGPQDIVRAAKIFEKMCREGLGSSCKRAGDVLLDTARDRQSLDEVARRYADACSLDAIEGCTAFIQTKQLEGVTDASRRAWAQEQERKLLHRQCLEGNESACSRERMNLPEPR